MIHRWLSCRPGLSPNRNPRSDFRVGMRIRFRDQKEVLDGARGCDSFSLPDDLEDGDWTVTVLNVEDRASGTLPIKLRVGKVSQVRKIE